MNPAVELMRRLGAGRPATITGTILVVTGQTLKVATSKGIIEARSVDATLYRVEDEVLVREGIVQGRVKRAADVPVYQV